MFSKMEKSANKVITLVPMDYNLAWIPNFSSNDTADLTNARRANPLKKKEWVISKKTNGIRVIDHWDSFDDFWKSLVSTSHIMVTQDPNGVTRDVDNAYPNSIPFFEPMYWKSRFPNRVLRMGNLSFQSSGLSATILNNSHTLLCYLLLRDAIGNIEDDLPPSIPILLPLNDTGYEASKPSDAVNCDQAEVFCLLAKPIRTFDNTILKSSVIADVSSILKELQLAIGRGTFVSSANHYMDVFRNIYSLLKSENESAITLDAISLIREKRVRYITSGVKTTASWHALSSATIEAFYNTPSNTSISGLPCDIKSGRPTRVAVDASVKLDGSTTEMASTIAVDGKYFDNDGTMLDYGAFVHSLVQRDRKEAYSVLTDYNKTEEYGWDITQKHIAQYGVSTDLGIGLSVFRAKIYQTKVTWNIMIPPINLPKDRCLAEDAFDEYEDPATPGKFIRHEYVVGIDPAGKDKDKLIKHSILIEYPLVRPNLIPHVSHLDAKNIRGVSLTSAQLMKMFTIDGADPATVRNIDDDLCTNMSAVARYYGVSVSEMEDFLNLIITNFVFIDIHSDTRLNGFMFAHGEWQKAFNRRLRNARRKLYLDKQDGSNSKQDAQKDVKALISEIKDVKTESVNKVNAVTSVETKSNEAVKANSPVNDDAVGESV